MLVKGASHIVVSSDSSSSSLVRMFLSSPPRYMRVRVSYTGAEDVVNVP